MPKKQKNKRERNKSEKSTKASKKHTQTEQKEGPGNLQFEDAFDDVVEEEEEVMATGENVNLMDDGEDDEKALPSRVWRAGVDEMNDGDTLDYDSSAYTAFHRMNVDWPCLTFDIIQDSLGHFRSNWPQTLYIAAGTQANKADQNKVMLLKVSDLHKTKHDDDSEEDASDEEGLDDDPVLEEKSFKHPGGVNRLRTMPQNSHIIATHSDTSKVHVWDAQQLLNALDKPPAGKVDVRPMHTFTGHASEGFAMDWSPVKTGRMVTGDCSRHMYLWEPHEGGTWDIDKVPFVGHSDSVEDVQFSPTEANVFASCSVDKTIRIWDIREKKNSKLFVAAHQTDVNVISWNKKVGYLLVSGADDGIVKVWDLRNFKSSAPAANFKWHRGPITSVQWHPTDESMLAVASADNSLTCWDMALEQDPEAKPEGAEMGEMDLPSQLLFIHQGQKDIKELRFHPQIPSLIISTALDGFNIFKTSNMK